MTNKIPAAATGESGLSVVEILISLVLSMLLTIAIFTVLHSTLYGAISQRGMSALQQSERRAATIMQQVANSGGYFVVSPTTSSTGPTPLSALSAATALAASAPFAAAGQYVYGTTGDTLDVRFQSALNTDSSEPSTMDCLGDTAPTSTPITYNNSFFVAPTTSSLDCSVNGGDPQILIGDGTNGGIEVDSMSVLYGVDTNGGGSVTEYLPASSVTDWNNVLSAQITLVFANPLYTAGSSNGQQATLPFSFLVNFRGAGSDN